MEGAMQVERPKSVERIYGIYTEDDALAFHYVGKTPRAVEERWGEHLRAAHQQKDMKDLYEFMRHEGIDRFHILELGDTSDGSTEADYIAVLRAQGHPLRNANAGNAVVAKKPDMTFRKLNRIGRMRMERAEKRGELDPQSIAMRLNALAWEPCDIQLLPMRTYPPDARAERVKAGNHTVYCAWYGEGEHATYYVVDDVERKQNCTRISWFNGYMTRLELLHHLEQCWGRIIWWDKHGRR